MDLAVALTAFALIVPVELPDKTFVATLVLSTKYRPLPVWLGVSAAFLIQTIIAVTLGGLLSRLPRTPVEVVVAVLFTAGGIYLLRSASHADEEEQEAEEEFAGKVRAGVTGLRAAGASFVVLFVAEWGDLSQLLTAGLVVKYQDPLSVGVGAFAALVLVSGLGALLGRTLLARMQLATIRRIGGGLCLVMATITVLSILGVGLPVG